MRRLLKIAFAFFAGTISIIDVYMYLNYCYSSTTFIFTYISKEKPKQTEKKHISSLEVQ